MLRTARFLLTLATFMLIVGSMDHCEAGDKFGAIAYSTSDGSYGYSYDYDTLWAAQEKALAECRKYGDGCTIVGWFRNACGALATSSDGAWGYSWGNSKSEAINNAMGQCRSHGGTNCTWRCWSCTTR